MLRDTGSKVGLNLKLAKFSSSRKRLTGYPTGYSAQIKYLEISLPGISLREMIFLLFGQPDPQSP